MKAIWKNQMAFAGLAHPVERLLPKQKVASSSLVTRSINYIILRVIT